MHQPPTIADGEQRAALAGLLLLLLLTLLLLLLPACVDTNANADATRCCFLPSFRPFSFFAVPVQWVRVDIISLSEYLVLFKNVVCLYLFCIDNKYEKILIFHSELK